jgi:hypothetical protein
MNGAVDFVAAFSFFNTCLAFLQFLLVEFLKLFFYKYKKRLLIFENTFYKILDIC